MRRIAGAGISFFGGLWWRRAGRGQFCCASGAGPAPRWRDTLQTARFLMVGALGRSGHALACRATSIIAERA